MVFVLLIAVLLGDGQVGSSFRSQVDSDRTMHQIGTVRVDGQSHKTTSTLTDLNGVVSGNVLMHIAHRQLRIGTFQPKRVIRQRNLQDDVVHLAHTGEVRQQTLVDSADGGIVGGDAHLF